MSTTQIITGDFDGKAIIPDRPAKAPVGKRLRIQITVDAPKKIGKGGKKTDRQRQFIGSAMFDSGIADLGSNKKHLEGLGGKWRPCLSTRLHRRPRGPLREISRALPERPG